MVRKLLKDSVFVRPEQIYISFSPVNYLRTIHARKQFHDIENVYRTKCLKPQKISAQKNIVFVLQSF